MVPHLPLEYARVAVERERSFYGLIVEVNLQEGVVIVSRLGGFYVYGALAFAVHTARLPVVAAVAVVDFRGGRSNQADGEEDTLSDTHKLLIYKIFNLC